MAVTRLGEKSPIRRESFLDGVKNLMEQVKAVLLERAEERMKEKISVVSTLDEASAAVKEGLAAVYWCGSEECADLVEKYVDASILGTEVRSAFINCEEGECIACKKKGKPAIVARSY